jgi:NADH pyrophosphatase NudC (nudix superfamily)
MEHGESEEQAVVRELREELQLEIRPVCRLWQSQPVAQLQLMWWLVKPVTTSFTPIPNPAEVARWFWMTDQKLADHPETMPTNIEFLAAVRNGTVTIPRTGN